jgi:hypothetical protein
LLDLLYSQIARARRRYYQRRPHLRRRLDVPVISIGNLTVGGSGKTPLAADVLLSRHYPGDGVIDFGPMTQAVLTSGYDRDIEVEIFNEEVWATDPLEVVRRTARSFAAAVSPHQTA